MRDELDAASTTLADAASDADPTVRDRLETQAEQLASLATADRGPDHGRLARHERALSEIADDDPGVADAVDDALAHVRAYRETVEGV
jgi:hypothetical protein